MKRKKEFAVAAAFFVMLSYNIYTLRRVLMLFELSYERTVLIAEKR